MIAEPGVCRTQVPLGIAQFTGLVLSVVPLGLVSLNMAVISLLLAEGNRGRV